MAKEFLQAGCNVTLSGRGEALPGIVHAELIPFEGNYVYIQCNVQNKASLQNLWDASLERWGGIDIWFNNAGQNAPHKFSWETGETYTENIINTNILGMIYGSQIAAAGMLKQGYGAIYSMEGLGSNNMIQVKTILYGTTKRALKSNRQSRSFLKPIWKTRICTQITILPSKPSFPKKQPKTQKVRL